MNIKTALLAAGLAGLLALQAVAIAVSWGGAFWVFGCVAGALVCGLAVARRRHLAGTTIAGLAIAAVAILVARIAGLPTEPSPVMALALGILVCTSVRRLPEWHALAATVGGLVVSVGGFLGTRPSASGSVAMINALIWLFAISGGLGLRLLAVRRQAATERVRRDERLVLARELHDVVAHHITGIVVQAQAAQLVARKQSDQLDESLTGIADAGTDALAAMRRVVGLLRDEDDAAPAMPTAPGLEQLPSLVEHFRDQGHAVELRLPESAEWPPELASTVYRVVQEALTNIARHAARAEQVTVSVERSGTGVTVEVTDDAPHVAARTPHRGGFGLIGMRERIEALGGTLLAGPRPGPAGWSVLATLPELDRR